jgi:hypothetical protein
VELTVPVTAASDPAAAADPADPHNAHADARAAGSVKAHADAKGTS